MNNARQTYKMSFFYKFRTGSRASFVPIKKHKMKNTIVATDLKPMFEEELVLPEVVEYGFPMADLIQGHQAPEEGAGFAIPFEGKLIGEQIKGKPKGIDHLEVRADGRYALEPFAHIDTDDGAVVQLGERGINRDGQLKPHVEFHTSDSRYSRLNREQVTGVGCADFFMGRAYVKGYSL